MEIVSCGASPLRHQCAGRLQAVMPSKVGLSPPMCCCLPASTPCPPDSQRYLHDSEYQPGERRWIGAEHDQQLQQDPEDQDNTTDDHGGWCEPVMAHQQHSADKVRNADDHEKADAWQGEACEQAADQRQVLLDGRQERRHAK